MRLSPIKGVQLSTFFCEISNPRLNRGASEALLKFIRMAPDDPDAEDLLMGGANRRMARDAAAAVADCRAALLHTGRGKTARSLCRATW